MKGKHKRSISVVTGEAFKHRLTGSLHFVRSGKKAKIKSNSWKIRETPHTIWRVTKLHRNKAGNKFRNERSYSKKRYVGRRSALRSSR